MADLYSDNVGTYRDTVRVRQYGYDTLQVSDVQLACNIKMLDASGSVSRENLSITPNPPKYYRMDQPIYIYYEIYNLIPGAPPDPHTDYTVQYALDYMGTDKYSVLDYIRRLIVNEKQVLEISTGFTGHGITRDESMFLEIDHNLTKTGPYRLTLTVTDNNGNKTAIKSTVLQIAK
jgi:hypothetical protein